MSHIFTYEIHHAYIKYKIIHLITESMTHLECLFRFYLSDYPFTWGKKQ